MAAPADKKWSEDPEGLRWLVDQYGGDTPPPDTSRVFALELDPPRDNVAQLSNGQHRAKRVLDLFGALVLVCVSAPIFLVAMLLVKLTSRGPIFYSQTRVGVNERGAPRDRRRRSLGPPPGMSDRRVANNDRRSAKQPGRVLSSTSCARCRSMPKRRAGPRSPKRMTRG